MNSINFLISPDALADYILVVIPACCLNKVVKSEKGVRVVEAKCHSIMCRLKFSFDQTGPKTYGNHKQAHAMMGLSERAFGHNYWRS